MRYNARTRPYQQRKSPGARESERAGNRSTEGVPVAYCVTHTQKQWRELTLVHLRTCYHGIATTLGVRD